MKRLGHFIFVRHSENWKLLFRFGLVGGSGVLVNLIVSVILNRTGPDVEGVFIDLPFTDFNVRWYHFFSLVSFMVANLWNFQLNRRFTFRSAKHSGWWREYGPFLVVGFGAWVFGLILLTLLMHPASPIGLPSSVFDNSSGLRTKFYWAQLIQIAVTVPVSFVLNKLWTFSSVRGGTHPSLTEEAVAEKIDETVAEQQDSQHAPAATVREKTAA